MEVTYWLWELDLVTLLMSQVPILKIWRTGRSRFTFGKTQWIWWCIPKPPSGLQDSFPSSLGLVS